MQIDGCQKKFVQPWGQLLCKSDPHNVLKKYYKKIELKKKKEKGRKRIKNKKIKIKLGLPQENK